MAVRSSKYSDMPLSTLLEGWVTPTAFQEVVISGIASDSRQLDAGYLFLALPGDHHHGLDFVPQALAAGIAALCYCEGDPRFETVQKHVDEAGITAVPVAELRRKAGQIADRFYHHPSQHLSVIGVTGTDGKTSVTHIIAQALSTKTSPCGVIGTLGNGVPGQLAATGMTTPDAISVQKALSDLVAQGATTVAMEVSSHALVQERVNGVDFDIAVLTNLGRDHLDYHGDLQAYRDAKAKLFQMSGLKRLVLNVDDAFGRELFLAKRSHMAVIGYSCQPEPPMKVDHLIHATQIFAQPTGLVMHVSTDDGVSILNSRLLGAFNASNLLAAWCVLEALGLTGKEIVHRLEKVRPIPGRMELFSRPGLPKIVVDYAHTPQALESALQAAREHAKNNIWCVFGCGGGRDAGKRPLMGALAEKHADRVVITDDNPRNESGQAIIDEILAGVQCPQNVHVERDRARALRYAFENAQPSDLILVAGKGHEDYQIIQGQRLHFSDRAYVADMLEGAT